MKKLIEIYDKEEPREFGLSAETMVDDGNEAGVVNIGSTIKKKGPGRPSGHSSGNVYTDIVTEDSNTAKKVKDTYEKKVEKGYAPQVQLIGGALAQANEMYAAVDEELKKYRERPGYGGRSRNIAMSNLMNTQVSLINTRITAIRELNSVRNKINDLVIKHDQIMKDSGDENSDYMIMKAYQGLLNANQLGMPQFMSPLHPTTINTGHNLVGQQVQSANIGSAPIITDDGSGVNMAMNPTSIQGMTPIQQQMVLEKNPSIKTVVVYNQSTGNKYFDVIDVTSGRSIPNVPRPGNFLLDDMRIDARSGLATNSNANMSYPLVVTGTRAMDEL